MWNLESEIHKKFYSQQNYWYKDEDVIEFDVVIYNKDKNRKEYYVVDADAKTRTIVSYRLAQW